MKRLFPVIATFLGLLVCQSIISRGQDAASTPGGSATNVETTAPASTDDLAKAIAEKQAEIDKLKQQLQDAKGKIRDLNSQNKKLQTSDSALKTEIQNAPPSVPMRPQPAPLAAAPNTSAPIDSQDLFWYYRNSPASANQYLTDRDIRVTGKIVGFDAPLVIRVFGIVLESGDPNLKVVCRFVVPQAYTGIILQRQTGTIFGVTAGGGRDPLLHMGDPVTIEGSCRGNNGGDVTLNACKLIL